MDFSAGLCYDDRERGADAVEPSIKRGQRLYIIQATLEYLVSIMVTGSFLAALTKELGFSDSLTGILSAIISLGCVFQLLTMSLRPRRSKPLVIALSIANQLLFTLLYVVPLSGAGKPLKVALAVVLILAAYVTYYLVHPRKTGWLMSLVEDGRRGLFTANKEIVSLLAGMGFSFLMGTVSDRFAAAGQLRTAFVITALVLTVLTVLHTLCMLFTPERETEATATDSLVQHVRQVLTNKNLMRVTLLLLLYQMGSYACIPFYGSYLIGELGLSLQTVSLLVMLSSVARILVSKAWGRYADARSFAAAFEKCLLVLLGAYLCALLAVPANGFVMFLLHYLLYGIAMGGINSALTNMVFDYVPPDRRADSLAVCQAVTGVAGFLTTLCVSPLVTLIQENGNRLLGIPLYAQQAVTGLGLVCTAGAVIYVRRVLIIRKAP